MKREALDHARMEKIPGWTLEACHLETCKGIPKEELRAVGPGAGHTRGPGWDTPLLDEKPVRLFHFLDCAHE